MTARRAEIKLPEFCEICARPLISRPVRRTGRCGARQRQHPLMLPLDLPTPQHPKGGESR